MYRCNGVTLASMRGLAVVDTRSATGFIGRYDRGFDGRGRGCCARDVAGAFAARFGRGQDVPGRGLPYVDMPIPALSARGPEDIVKKLKMAVEPLAGYENHDGLLLSNGTDVTYEHSETWTFPTGERGVLRFVTVHKVVLQNGEAKIAVWKDYYDLTTLTSFAPPNHFENLAGFDTSWIFDASGLI